MRRGVPQYHIRAHVRFRLVRSFISRGSGQRTHGPPGDLRRAAAEGDRQRLIMDMYSAPLEPAAGSDRYVVRIVARGKSSRWIGLKIWKFNMAILNVCKTMRIALWRVCFMLKSWPVSYQGRQHLYNCNYQAQLWTVFKNWIAVGFNKISICIRTQNIKLLDALKIRLRIYFNWNILQAFGNWYSNLFWFSFKIKTSLNFLSFDV